MSNTRAQDEAAAMRELAMIALENGNTELCDETMAQARERDGLG